MVSSTAVYESSNEKSQSYLVSPTDVRRIRYVPTEREKNLEKFLVARRKREFALGLMVPLAILLLWEICGRMEWLDPRAYPPPSKILREGYALAMSGSLFVDIWATLLRVLAGFMLGTIAGLVAGFAMGMSRPVRAAFEPTLNALYVVPKLAILPVLLTIFGFGELPKIVLVAITVFFFVWIDAMDSVSSVPTGYRDAAKVFGTTRWGMLKHVLLPAVLPRLFISLRIAIGVAVLVIIAAEFVISRNGLGFLIFNARQLFINGWMYVGIVCVAAMGVILAAIIRRIGLIMTPWERVGSSARDSH